MLNLTCGVDDAHLGESIHKELGSPAMGIEIFHGLRKSVFAAITLKHVAKAGERTSAETDEGHHPVPLFLEAVYGAERLLQYRGVGF